MASYPPYGVDPRQQRQYIRDQVRMQKAAARAQRDLFREQARAMRRRSLLGPLLIVAIGVVALLVRMGTFSLHAFAQLYGRWWPLLLVASGLVLLAEWAFDQRVQPDTSVVGRRGIGGGVALLLVALALAGAALQTIHRHEFFINGLGLNPENIGEFLGEKHELEQTINEAFVPGTSLAIENPHGDVTILGKSDDNKIHITINKQLFSRTDENADEKGRQFSPRIEHNGGTVNVVMPALNGAISDLSITVPASALTTVNAIRGDVRVSALHAPVNITANHGEVEVDAIVGAVTAHVNDSDGSFAAHGITGDVFLKGHAQDVTVSNISGQVNLEGDFYGDTHLEHVQGPVAFETSRTHLTLDRLDGEIDISPDSELTASQIVGPVVLRTRSRNIAIEGLMGSADITNSNGSVDITSNARLSTITVDNKDGSVNVTVPQHAGFTVDAETREGEIKNEMNLSSTTSGDRVMLNGTVGDGSAKLHLVTDHADIELHHGSPAPPQASPAPPSKPGKSV